MRENNINECLADTNRIGVVENVDTRKVVVSVENEAVLNTLKINDIIILAGSNSDEKLIGILIKVIKKRIDFDETDQEEDILYSNNCCVINLVGSFYNKYGAVYTYYGHANDYSDPFGYTNNAKKIVSSLNSKV